jgi:hypothetical protein
MTGDNSFLGEKMRSRKNKTACPIHLSQHRMCGEKICPWTNFSTKPRLG